MMGRATASFGFVYTTEFPYRYSPTNAVVTLRTMLCRVEFFASEWNIHIAHLRQEYHNSKFVIFQEKPLEVLMCYNFFYECNDNTTAFLMFKGPCCIENVFSSIINKMQRYTIRLFQQNALPFSGGYSAHH
jgi:hypothetical protein